jgi:hypothetical protein
MSEKNTPGVPGQDPTPDGPNPLAEALALLRGISTRLRMLEQRFEYLERDVVKATDAESLSPPARLIEEEEDDEPTTEPGLDPMPALALRSDGAVLLSPEYLDEASLKGRVVWTGVVLTLAESCDALDALNGAACDAGAHIGGRLIALARKKKAKDEGGDGDE